MPGAKLSEGPRVAAMPGVILVILDHPEEASGLLTATSCLADLIGGAVINALIARTPPQATISTEEILTKQRENYIRAQEQVRAAAIAQVFRDWLRSASSVAHISDIEVVAAEAVAQRGPNADFVVIEQPAHRRHGRNAQTISSALFETDRPVLVVPPGCKKDFGRRIAVAWRDDNRTISAVRAAMRCLGHVERLLVLAGQRDGAARPQMPEILVEHGVPAELFVLPIGRHAFGAALLDRAHELGADMIAMGAYAHHSPLREMIFGGVTRYMIEHADVPVLMRH
jgi:nucleotide-binding universal stress UspA family protein